MLISTFASPDRASAGRPRAKRIALIALIAFALAFLQCYRVHPVSTSGLVSGKAFQALLVAFLALPVFWLIGRRHRPSQAPVRAALVFALALNLGVFNGASERKRDAEAIQKAAPILEAFRRGESPSDDEIRAAKVGPLEPSLLVGNAFRRQFHDVLEDYDSGWNALDIESMLDPEVLADPKSRAESGGWLDEAVAIHGEFEKDIAALFDGYPQQAVLAMKGVPGPRPKEADFARGLAPMRGHYLSVARQRREQHKLARELIDFVSANPKAFTLMKWEPFSMVFRDKGLQAAYQAHLARISAQRQQMVDGAKAFDALMDKRGEDFGEMLRKGSEGR
ncbi:hypothetical protein [Mitsuaria sp. GD03876]|uniref:hypothetical protein n=1 Tax=Mitsuaria sp. GD03876 TaxID=2975399 RepID=UPI00244899AC|nr:hypothetical protein [Mitsuaria sp. GD03876]MDH0863502.1 hypothetical protein [Mitsuaria sp. GD03876]